MSSHLPFKLSLIGIPPGGAKSRVETQIKLDLQLVHPISSEFVVNTYDYLKLPSYGVSKEKFRMNNLKDVPKDVDSERILHLDASVVCTSQPTRSVFICEGCILRERKRALRKKDYKRKTNKKPPPSPTLPPGDQSQKIIVFNCPELIPFSSGTCSLPTRITCYCRHHKEKVGFRIVLVVKDAQGVVVGQCVSENIMITDDHKAQAASTSVPGGASGRGSDAEPSSKRRSSEEGRGSATHSRRSSLDSQDGISVTSSSTGRKRKEALQLPTPPNNSAPPPQPATLGGNVPVGAGGPAKQVKIPRNLSMTKLKMEPLASANNGISGGSSGGKYRASPYPQTANPFMRTQSMEAVPTFFNSPSTAAQTSAPSNAGGRWQHRSQQSITAPNSRSNSPPDLTFPPSNANLNSTIPRFDPSTPFSGIQSAPVSNAASPEDSTFTTFSRWNLENPIPGITIPTEIDTPGSSSLSVTPIISKIIPSEGPTAGGIEVTILGQNFTQGITAQFGEKTAIPTECYSSTTLVCLLPPSATPGPVFVTLKDAFGRTIDTTSVNGRIEQQRLFTYINTADKALMELALQIMGFKWLGKLEDARNVAAMIIGNQSPGGNTSGAGMAGEMMTGGTLQGAALENALLKILDVIDLDTSPHPARLGQRTKTGHTMLHFAAMSGMRRLVAGLLVRGVNPAIRDRAGYTALHYASWLGRGKVVQRLLSGDNSGLLAMKTLEGKTPEDLAVDSGRDEICQLLQDYTVSGGGTLSRVSSVASLVSSLSRGSLDEYFAGSEWDESSFEPPESDDEEENTRHLEEDDEQLWLGSLRQEGTGSSDEPSTPSTASSVTERRRFFQIRTPQLPDPQTLNPALYVNALNEMLQPYLQALRLINPDHKLATLPPGLSPEDTSDADASDKKYDLPPPAYSELYPAPVVEPKQQFSLATRLSLRGRSFLRWTGMAGDAGLSPEEIEFLRREDVRTKTWTTDYMLFFFWVCFLLPF